MVVQDGTSLVKPIKKATTGDVVQYSATYRNNINKPMTDVAITLPIPANMIYTGIAKPDAALASLDGKKFDPIPLKRVVNSKLVEILPSEYRALRWIVKTLAPQKSATVTMNAKVK